MNIREIWPAFGIPAVGFILGIYHKYVIDPRLSKVEKYGGACSQLWRIGKIEEETKDQGELLARIDERTKIILFEVKKNNGGK
jgi:hypothetical protein